MPCIAIELLVALALLSETTDCSLKGTVLDLAGQPVAGARIDLAVAQPRVGPAMFCPSCYLDCRKFATTDKDGNFEIAKLDPSLQFRVLCTANDKKTSLSSWYDPDSGPLAFKLADLPKDFPVERMVRGKIVSDQGIPIAGALVDPIGAATDTKKWGGPVDVDPVVSDKSGNFVLLLPPDYRQVSVSVTIAGTAGVNANDLDPGVTEHRVELQTGARVIGRIADASRALAGQRVAVVQLNRSGGGHFIKAVETETDIFGRFEFNYLPPDESYVVFSPVAPLLTSKVLQTKRFDVPANGKACDLGTLNVGPSFEISGRVELPNGQKLPANSKLCAHRDPAWDLVATEIQPDGTFEFIGLPPEPYSFRLVVPGFVIDTTKVPYQTSFQDDRFELRLTESIVDLRIPAKPDDKATRAAPRNGATDEKPALTQTLQGIIVDLNGKPVAGINVTRKPNRGAYPRGVTTKSDGLFTLVNQPDEPIELVISGPANWIKTGEGSRNYYNPKIRPARNQQDIRVIYDPSLCIPLEEIQTRLVPP